MRVSTWVFSLRLLAIAGAVITGSRKCTGVSVSLSPSGYDSDIRRNGGKEEADMCVVYVYNGIA